ncbi:MAG: 3-hydroxyisobutyrate dehydrogenase [Rhodospirillaceae bacterium]|nr:3-hydroxyisobutyrate dehydrogenase [Rhodospirillaceae bacterium]
MKFGYIGLGNMGGAIAKRMLLVHEIIVFDLSKKLRQEFSELGAETANSVYDLGVKADVIFLCLPTSNEVRDVVLGPEGLTSSMKGGIICDMTTGDPVVTREIAEQLPTGITLIDGPVSGGPAGAAAGTLAIMVGGSDNAVGQAMPALEAVSPNIFRTGGVGTGHVMKLANNMLNATNRLATFEALALATKNGIEPDLCAEILNKSSGRNFATDVTLPKFVLAHDKPVQGFTLGLMHKDIRQAAELGISTGVTLPVVNAAREIYHAALNERTGDIDVNEVIRHYERGSQLKLAGSGKKK